MPIIYFHYKHICLIYTGTKETMKKIRDMQLFENGIQTENKSLLKDSIQLRKTTTKNDMKTE